MSMAGFVICTPNLKLFIEIKKKEKLLHAGAPRRLRRRASRACMHAAAAGGRVVACVGEKQACTSVREFHIKLYKNTPGKNRTHNRRFIRPTRYHCATGACMLSIVIFENYIANFDQGILRNSSGRVN